MDTLDHNPPVLFLSEQEFLSLAFDIYSYWEKFGYFGMDKRVYDARHLPPAEEYLDFCAKTVRFIDNLPNFSSCIDVASRTPYAEVLSAHCISRLFLFSMVWDYYEQFKCPMPKGDSLFLSILDKNHLKDLAWRVGLIRDNILADKHLGILIDYDCATSTFLYDPDTPNRTAAIFPFTCHTIEYHKDYFGPGEHSDGFLFPYLIVEDGCTKLYQPKFLKED